MMPELPSSLPKLYDSADATLVEATFAQSTMAQLLLEGTAHRVRAANPAACRLMGAFAPASGGAALLGATFEAEFAPKLDHVYHTGVMQVVRARPRAAARHGHVFDLGLRRWQRPDGAPGGVSITAIDVSAYEHLREHARATDEARGAFTDGIAHDLRGPLTAVRLALESIVRAQVPERVHTKATRALHALRRADDLVENLLDISEVRAGVLLPCSRARIDLVPPLRGVLRECRETLQHTVHFAHEAQLIGPWDARLVGRALYNLVQNAVKYGAADAPVEVGLHRVPNQSFIELRVRNKGPDIAPQDQRRILGRFVRGQASSEHTPGWGLGLMVVQTVAQAHEGHLVLVSADGVTEFCMRLSTLDPHDDARTS